MQTKRRAKLLGRVTVGLSVGMLTGCQTWFGGMTLPSPHYLEHHNPQYFPAEPQFPLPRELGYQEEAAGLLHPRDKAAPVGAAPVPGIAPPPPPAGALGPGNAPPAR
jgi:hypothetical protein